MLVGLAVGKLFWILNMTGARFGYVKSGKWGLKIESMCSSSPSLEMFDDAVGLSLVLYHSLPVTWSKSRSSLAQESTISWGSEYVPSDVKVKVCGRRARRSKGKPTNIGSRGTKASQP